jgi:hypothetical protein
VKSAGAGAHLRGLGALAVLCVALGAAAAEGDADGDGVADAKDNCAFAANPSQADRGGVGGRSKPDGVGDACQCGDVNGDGRVTTADAAAIEASVADPRGAILARPELCDVGGWLRCTAEDAKLLARALETPPTALVAQCHAPRTAVVQGDTQTLTRHALFAALWEKTQQQLCAEKGIRNLDVVLATGDVVEAFGMASAEEVARADRAYDLLDACGIPQLIPGGNHDTNCTYQGCPAPPFDWSAYLRFLETRPSHRPGAQSPSGLSFAAPIFLDFWALALPFAADAQEEAWANGALAAAPAGRRYWLIEHDAVLNATGALNPPRAAARLAAAHPQRVLGVIGGHFIPGPDARRWLFTALPSGQLTLFSNYQEFDPRAQPNLEPFSEVTLLEYLPLADRWCASDRDFVSGAVDRFGPRVCF